MPSNPTDYARMENLQATIDEQLSVIVRLQTELAATKAGKNFITLPNGDLYEVHLTEYERPDNVELPTDVPQQAMSREQLIASVGAVAREGGDVGLPTQHIALDILDEAVAEAAT